MFQRDVKPILSVVMAALFVTLYSPILSGQRERPKAELSVRQRTEVLFHNGIRNAQRKNDVYGQVHVLKRTLVQVQELRASQPRQTVKDEKALDKRVSQLQRMIKRESPVEIL